MLTIKIDELGVRQIRFKARTEAEARRIRALTEFVRPDLFELSSKLQRRAQQAPPVQTQSRGATDDTD